MNTVLNSMIHQDDNDHSKEKERLCSKRVENSLVKCPRVSFIVKAMEKMGCALDSAKYACMECDGKISGGFSLDDHGQPGIVLCQNHINEQDSMDRTIAHELLHAYDHCRAKVNWKNCEHQACSEVRAASLSGDCDWKLEVSRGHYGSLAKQHQHCVRRRAELSLSFQDVCKGKEKECVQSVFDTCYRDTQPFHTIP